MVSYQVPEAMFICASKYTISGKAAAVVASAWLCLQNFTLIHHVSFVFFCRDKMGELNGDTCFKSLVWCYSCYSLQDMRLFFIYYHGWEWESFWGFCMTFCLIIALTTQVREPIWGFCQLQNVSQSIIYLGTQKWPLAEVILRWLIIYPWFLKTHKLSNTLIAWPSFFTPVNTVFW